MNGKLHIGFLFLGIVLFVGLAYADNGYDGFCGDGICDEFLEENFETCPEDCPPPEEPPPEEEGFCGDWICQEHLGENPETCPEDCGEIPPEEPEEEDWDGDGIPNADDQCPDEPETYNDFEDEDGCPDEVPEEPEEEPGEDTGPTTIIIFVDPFEHDPELPIRVRVIAEDPDGISGIIIIIDDEPVHECIDEFECEFEGGPYPHPPHIGTVVIDGKGIESYTDEKEPGMPEDLNVTLICDDSDGGKNYGQWGFVTTAKKGAVHPGSGFDKCINSTYLQEFYCDENGFMASEIYKCPVGCCNGACGTDPDNDGIIGKCDNCPNTYNPKQEDNDSDSVGDACDKCASYNPSQKDTDKDGIPDACDNCPYNASTNQTDTDKDGWGDICDNCPNYPNYPQLDVDNDGRGNACDCLDNASGGDENGIDCGGKYCPPCSVCTTGAKWAPSDTPCKNHWPTNDGPTIGMNTQSDSCNLVEVCHPELDYIVADAINCCEHADYKNIFTGHREAGKESACNYARTSSGLNLNYNPTTFKKCLGLYGIRSLGSSAVYMQGYFHGEWCCLGSEKFCPSGCSDYKVNPAAWEMGTSKSCIGPGGARPDFKMGGHRCEYKYFLWETWGKPGYWNSDTNWKSNSDSVLDAPAHASINRLSTGTCVDYSFALTTILRKMGYSKDDALSVNGKGHGYNLVKFPGDTKWHYVDTVGNSGGGVLTNPNSHCCKGTPSSCSIITDSTVCTEVGCSWTGSSCSGTPPKYSCALSFGLDTEADCKTVNGCEWKVCGYDYCRNMKEGCSNDYHSQSKSNCPLNTQITGCEVVP